MKKVIKSTCSATMVIMLCCMCLVACSSSDSEDSSMAAFPESVSGYWFICEFDDAANCNTMDDDGLSLTSDGSVLSIEESSQGSLPECAGSPCFASDVASVEVVQSAIGTYSYSDGQLSVSIGDCNETRTLLVENSEQFIQILECDAEFDGSSADDGSLLRQYNGAVEVVSSPG